MVRPAESSGLGEGAGAGVGSVVACTVCTEGDVGAARVGFSQARATDESGSSGLSAHAVFEILIRQQADMLVAYLRSLLGRDDATVDDMFQQSMLVAWRRLADYDRSRPFGAWLRGIAHMLVLEHARKSRARPLSTDPGVLEELDRRFGVIESGAGDEFRDKVQRLRACVDRLPEAMREAIDLVYARGLLIGAAAQSVGASEEGMKKRVQRARQLLATCLRGEEAPRE